MQCMGRNRSVGLLAPAFTNGAPAMPGQVQRQDAVVQHHPAEHAANEGDIELTHQMRMRSQRIEQRQQTHPDREDTGCDQGL